MRMRDITKCIEALILINGEDAVITGTIAVGEKAMFFHQYGDDEEAYKYHVEHGKVYINDDPRW